MISSLFLGAAYLGLSLSAHVITPTERELAMLDEVNYVRTNPIEYANYIESYTKFWESDREELAAAAELRKELTSMKKVDSLKWSPILYHDAFTHGNYLKKTKKFEHSDYEWAENIVSGDETVRFAIINLLIDSGIASRGHRKNLLNSNYTEFAVYEVPGLVGEWDFVFVQEFN